MAVLVGWTATFQLGGMTAQGAILGDGLRNMPWFIVLGFGSSLAGIFGLRQEVGLLLIGVVAIALALFQRRPLDGVAVVAAAAGVATEFALIGLVRSQFGDQAASWARYQYVSIPLLLIGLSAWFGTPATIAPGHRRMTFVGVSLILAIALIGNVRMLILGRGAALIWADRARAVALLAETVPDLPAYVIIQFPLPERLRAIEAEFGKLDRDALLGVTFPRPSGDSIKYICEFFYEGDPPGSERCTSLGLEAAT